MDHVHVHVIELEEFQRVVESFERGIVALLESRNLVVTHRVSRLAPFVVSGGGERTTHAGPRCCIRPHPSIWR